MVRGHTFMARDAAAMVARARQARDPVVWRRAVADLADIRADGAAADLLRCCLVADPGDPELLARACHLTTALGRIDRARAWNRRWAMAADDPAEALFEGAHLKVYGGEPGPGWDLLVHRWRIPKWQAVRAPFDSRIPPWRGESLAGRPVLVWATDGLAEAVGFAGMYPEILAEAAAAYFLVDSRLAGLFRRSFPAAQINMSAGPAGLIQAPAVDLLARYRRHWSDFDRGARPWLVADPHRVAQARNWLDSLGPGLRVGISWRSLRAKAGRNHTTMSPLSAWRNVLAVPGVVFVLLQYDHPEADVAGLDIGAPLHAMPGLDLWADIEGVAALSAALDLVIAPPTFTVHLAGALGTETWWVLGPPANPHALNTDRIPWFPGARAFFRPDWGQSWAVPLARVAEALAARVGQVGEAPMSGAPPSNIIPQR